MRSPPLGRGKPGLYPRGLCHDRHQKAGRRRVEKLWRNRTLLTGHPSGVAVPAAHGRAFSLWRPEAGEVVIEGVEGDMDFEVDAGRIAIRMFHPEECRRRDASVRAGNSEG